MMQLSAHARLGKDPRQIDTSTGTTMAVVPAAVSVPIARSEAHSTAWLDLACFGKTAETLLRHRQGDLINIMGNVQIRQWTDKEGQPRESWSLIVEALVSARTTRPGGGRKRDNGQQRQQQAAGQFQQPEFVDDELPPF